MVHLCEYTMRTQHAHPDGSDVFVLWCRGLEKSFGETSTYIIFIVCAVAGLTCIYRE